MAKVDNSLRFYEIDLLRFLAALSVVFFHYTFRGYAEGDYIPVEFIVLKDISKYGYLGVDLFFLISGFVILMTAYNRTVTSFVISRITRLYPAFWISVSLTAVIIVIFGQPKFTDQFSQYLYNLSMISGFFGVEHVDGVYWSLLVEIKFYFLIFLLIISRQIHFIGYYLGLWLVLILINNFYPLPGIVEFFLFPEWAPYFLAGATYFLIRHEGLSMYKISLILGSCLIAILNATQFVEILSQQYITYFSSTVIALCIAGFYLFFLLMVSGKTRFISQRVLVSLGALTYPLYLTHQMIGYIYFQHFSDEKYKYLSLAFMIFLSLLIAYLINTQIEQRYGRKFKVFLEKFTDFLIDHKKLNDRIK